MLQPDFVPAPTAVRIHRCGYVSPCKARGCPKRATLIAEKIDAAGAVFDRSSCARYTAKSSSVARGLAVLKFATEAKPADNLPRLKNI